MAVRATWKGFLKVSLITVPIKVYTAVSSSNKVRLNMLHKDCNQRLKQFYQCPEHGPVEKEEIVKGYEYEKGKYLSIDKQLLDQVKVESSKTIEITQFIAAGDLDTVYLNAAYYLGPDGPVADESYGVLREALVNQDKVAIGTICMRDKEYVVVIQPRGQGLLMSTLHYASEVRDHKIYFGDLTGKVNMDQVKLFETLMENMGGQIDFSTFSDRYNDSLVKIIKDKLAGKEPEVVQEEQVAQVSDFMAALKASVETMPKSGPAESIDIADQQKKDSA